MNPTKRNNGWIIRKIAKLDRAWRLAGKPEGRTANDLSMYLGMAARRGMHSQARRAQRRSAARLGQRIGWAPAI